MGGRPIQTPNHVFLGGYHSHPLLHHNTASAEKPAVLASAKSLLSPALDFAVVPLLDDC